MIESGDTVILTRSEYRGLLQRLEDAEDRAVIAARRDDPTLSVERVARLLAGESAVLLWREERGLSQRALASAAGLSPAMLSEIENGKKTPSLPAAKALADALGLDLDDLFG